MACVETRLALDGMAHPKMPLLGSVGSGPLSIPQLETGLRLLGRGDLDHYAFWDANIDAFRRTVLFAIRETSDALLSPSVPVRWRVELEGQLEELFRYIELAERYITRRRASCGQSGSEFRLTLARIH
jgi:hypothetical protein